jgi:four helix bundle protein
MSVLIQNSGHTRRTTLHRESQRLTPRGYKDPHVYQAAYELAVELFKLSKTFPQDERFSLTSQIRRSSRSVVANLAEGYRKRQYPNMFVSKLADCDGEATETQVWLDFTRDCGYLSEENHKRLSEGYCEVGRMLSSMISHPEKFCPKQVQRQPGRSGLASRGDR